MARPFETRSGSTLHAHPLLAHRIFAQNVRDMRLMPAAEIDAGVKTMLSRLLRHVAALVSFYQPYAALLHAAADGDPEAWASVPVLTQDNFRGLGLQGIAVELPDGEEALPSPRSWISLSTPIEGPLGLLGDIADKAQWEFLASSLNVDTSGRLAAILPSAAIQPGDLAEAFEPWSIDAHRGRANRWPDHLDPASTLAWLENIEATCLFADAASVERLFDIARPGRLTFADLFVWQPPQPSAGFADRCRHAFGVSAIEVVVSRLCGFVASTCRFPSESFSAAAETTFVEIVDARGYPTEPGEPGRLLATGLYSCYRPVIRQDLGLRAVWDELGPSAPLSQARQTFRVVG